MYKYLAFSLILNSLLGEKRMIEIDFDYVYQTKFEFDSTLFIDMNPDDN